jgi:photosystem II stability/assembly factor-like uncharacterized protein
MFRTTDAGLSWSPTPRISAQSIHGISFSSNTIGVAVGEQGAILRTTNGGEVWNDHSIQPTSTTSLYLSGVSFNTSGAGIIVGKSDSVPGVGSTEIRAAIFRTLDAGVTWVRQSAPWKRWLRAISFGDQQTVMAVGDSGLILRSTDTGSTWNELHAGTAAIRLNGVCSFGTSTTIAVGDSGTVLRTDNGGATWKRQQSGTASRLTSVWIAKTNSAFVTGDNGTVLRTTDGGATWIPQASGTLNALYGAAFNGANSLIAVGDRGSIVRTTVTEVVSLIGRPSDAAAPFEFALDQNYPNPFNPTTAIRYQVPAISDVTLRIYDVLGRQVAELANGIRIPGTHIVHWNASTMASGVYFCQLSVVPSARRDLVPTVGRDGQAGTNVATRKMLLLR